MLRIVTMAVVAWGMFSGNALADDSPNAVIEESVALLTASLDGRKEELTKDGIPRLFDVQFLKLGTYKDEWSEGRGWNARRGGWPKPVGGLFLRFSRAFRTNGRAESVEVEVRKAPA